MKISSVWGISSAGRAPALHAGGQRFDPAILHHLLKLTVVIIRRNDTKLNISSKVFEFIFDFRIKNFSKKFGK